MKRFISNQAHIISYVNKILTIEIPENEHLIFTEFYSRPLDKYHLEIKTPFKSRSTGWKSQNHHFNGHIMQMASIIGYTFDELKYIIKYKCMALGWPTKYDYSEEPMPKSETEVSVTEMTIGIEYVHQLAAEWKPPIILKEDDNDTF